MKSNRNTIIILIAAVAAIWGTIIYKILVKRPHDNLPAAAISVGNKELKKQEEKYSLLLNYGDPFFPTKKLHKVKVVAPAHKRSIKKQKPQFRWPAIKYNGCISSEENIRGHLTYNGVSIILKPGDSLDKNYMIKEIYNDSVLISYKNEKKWFFK